MSDVNQSVDVQAEPQATANGSSAATPAQPQPTTGLFEGQTAESWYKQYTGSQRALREKQTELEQFKNGQTSILSEKEKAIAQLQSQLTALTADRDTLLQAKSQYETTAKQLEKEKSVRDLIDTEFPQLRERWIDPIWRAGALAAGQTMELDALKQHFAGSLTSLQQQSQQIILQANKGGAPPPPPQGQSAQMSSEEVQRALLRSAPGSPEYKSLLEQLYKVEQVHPPEKRKST
jgi:myosin heavy subunit